MNYSGSESGAVVLVVDDEPVYHKIIEEMLLPEGVLIFSVYSLEEAWMVLNENTVTRFDVVLLDRILPDGDGLGLLGRMRETASLQDIPVIVQSGRGESGDVEHGLRQGAWYYLAKPYRANILRALIRVAVKDLWARRSLLSSLDKVLCGQVFMHKAEFEIRTMGDVAAITPYLASFYPDPESVAHGVAQLLTNAIEHGNLEIGSVLKGKLLEEGRWEREVEVRQALPEFRNRLVQIAISRQDSAVELVISDEGTGFDWRAYDQFDEDRMFQLHGRGITLARSFCFDEVAYSEKGNEVRCRVDL